MNIYIPKRLVESAIEIIGITGKTDAEKQKKAVNAIYKQCRRIYYLYLDTDKGKKPKHALYWSQIDTFALYTLTSCQILSKRAVDRALHDLECVEAMLVRLPPEDQQVYNRFALFVESLTAPPRKLTINKFKTTLQQWCDTFSLGQLKFLALLVDTYVSFRPLASHKEESKDEPDAAAVAADLSPRGFLAKSARDAVSRIRAAAHKTIQERFRERMQFIAGQLQLIIIDREKSGTSCDNTATSVQKTTAQLVQNVSAEMKQHAADAAPMTQAPPPVLPPSENKTSKL